MTKKTWLIFVVLCAVIIGGLVYLSRGNKVDVTNVDQSTIQAASKENGSIADHTLGNSQSKVILVEYGDYQCPGCGSAYPVIKQVVEKYKEKIGFVFRNYPLYSIHPNALAAASAAEAAGLSNKYWEMHDKLYENQNAWNQLSGTDRTNYFASVAESLGIESATFSNNLTSAAIKQKIDFDHALGAKAGVDSTPAFYLNGKDVGNLYVRDNKLVPKGTDGAQLVWSDATAFETFVIAPALKEHGL